MKLLIVPFLFLLIASKQAFAITESIDSSDANSSQIFDNRNLNKDDKSEDKGLIAINPNAAEGAGNNQLATSLCQVILLLNGRIGRAIAIIATLVLAFTFMSSKLNVAAFLAVIVGITMIFGAKSIALILLPSFVEVRDPGSFSTSGSNKVKKTTDEIIRDYCPELV
jgi:type IV secretory pathway VirB2 component (pilin)